MHKKIRIILFFSFLNLLGFAQEKGNALPLQNPPTIEGLVIFPNPLSGGKLNVTTKSNAEKKIEIFDVLGKKVFETTTVYKELNVSNLLPGVYIIKVKENNISNTRKLVIN